MAKRTKLWLITAVALVIVGSIAFGGAMMALKWDFTKLSTYKYETNSHAIDVPFESISIVSDTAKIQLVPSENTSAAVVCYEQENAKHTVSVQDGTLTIQIAQRKWHQHIGINFSTPKITLYIPQAQYNALTIHSSTGDITIPEDFQFQRMDISLTTGDVTNRASTVNEMCIKTTTGDIFVQNASAGALRLSVSTGKTQISSVTCDGNVITSCSTGKTTLEDIQCLNITSTGTTGDIRLKNVIAAEIMNISRSTGDISFTGCDANELILKASTGNITGTLLSSKVFIANSSTGHISVPESVTGGKCKVTTSTGNINFTLD